MLIRKLVVVGLVGFVTLAAGIAAAEEAVGPSATHIGVDAANFADPADAFSDRFQLDISPGREARFAAFAPDQGRAPSRGRDRRDFEVSVVANAGNGVDVAFAQRGGVGFNAQGDVERQSRSSEVRLGRGLRNMRDDAPPGASRWYLFAASEDEALIWTPGSRNEFGAADGGFALQDRVEIGDIQAGVTYEANGWQTSLAYVQRQVSARSGARTYHRNESFVGLTVTMRH